MIEWTSDAYKIKAPLGSIIKVLHDGKTESVKVLGHHTHDAGHSMMLSDGSVNKKLKFRLGYFYNAALNKKYEDLHMEEGEIIYSMPKAGWYNGKNGCPYLLLRRAVKDFCVGIGEESHSVMIFKNNKWELCGIDCLLPKLTPVIKTISEKRNTIFAKDNKWPHGVLSTTLSIFDNSLYFLNLKIGIFVGDSLFVDSPEFNGIIDREIHNSCRIKNF